MRLRENGEIDIEISRVIYVCKELPMPTYRFGHWINKLNNSLCQHCRMGKNESQKACAHANAYCMLSGSPCQSENLMNHKVAFLRLTCTQHKMTLTCGQSGMYISHVVERQGKKKGGLYAQRSSTTESSPIRLYLQTHDSGDPQWNGDAVSQFPVIRRPQLIQHATSSTGLLVCTKWHIRPLIANIYPNPLTYYKCILVQSPRIHDPTHCGNIGSFSLH